MHTRRKGLFQHSYSTSCSAGYTKCELPVVLMRKLRAKDLDTEKTDLSTHTKLGSCDGPSGHSASP